MNHYITSERFLDERTTRYPANFHGGNGRHVYADVEAVRVCATGVAGPREILSEAWERYRLPLAVTELHLGCTREEQLRWVKEVWDAAVELRSQQIDVQAVTAWAAFGAFDWNSLLTCDAGCLRTGSFRSPFTGAAAHCFGEDDSHAGCGRDISITRCWTRRVVAPFGPALLSAGQSSSRAGSFTQQQNR